MYVFELRRILHEVPGHYKVWLLQEDSEEVMEALPAEDSDSFTVDHEANELHLR